MSPPHFFRRLRTRHSCGPSFLIPIIASCLIAAAPAVAENVLLVKAGFITKFPGFVTWPEKPDNQAQARFAICILGTSELNAALMDVAQFARIKQTKPLIRRLSGVQESDGCEMLYIAGSENRRLEKIIAHTRDKPILTVGDSPGFAERGVLINLFTDKRQVRFEINRGAVRRSGLRISFRLFELARIIK